MGTQFPRMPLPKRPIGPETRWCPMRLNTFLCLSVAALAFVLVPTAPATSKYEVLHSFSYGEQHQIGPPEGSKIASSPASTVSGTRTRPVLSETQPTVWCTGPREMVIARSRNGHDGKDSTRSYKCKILAGIQRCQQG